MNNNEIIDIEVTSNTQLIQQEIAFKPKFKEITITLNKQEQVIGFDKQEVIKNAIIAPMSISLQYEINQHYTSSFIPTWEKFFIYDNNNQKINIKKIINIEELDNLKLNSHKLSFFKDEDDDLNINFFYDSENKYLYRGTSTTMYHENIDIREKVLTKNKLSYSLRSPFEVQKVLNGLSIEFQHDFNYQFLNFGNLTSIKIAFLDLFDSVVINENIKEAYMTDFYYKTAQATEKKSGG